MPQCFWAQDRSALADEGMPPRGPAAAGRRLAIAAMLFMAACALPVQELDRAPTPANVSAASLLPPGRIKATTLPGSVDGATAVLQDGARMAALRFASVHGALAAFLRAQEHIAARRDITSRNRFAAGAVRYLRYSGAKLSGLVWISGTWVFFVEAGDAASVAAVIRASHAGGLTQSSERRVLALLPWLIGFGLVLGAALIIIIAKMILRSLARPPVAGASVLSREALTQRLLALNEEDKPYLVRRGPEADLVVEWKFADAQWWGLLAKAGVHKAYRLRLYLEEDVHRVGALDEFGDVEWSAGLLAAPRVQFTSGFFRGVQIARRERGAAYGFETPTGGGAGKVLDYRFDIDEVKAPVIAAVTGAGWRYQPILWPRRRQT